MRKNKRFLLQIATCVFLHIACVNAVDNDTMVSIIVDICYRCYYDLTIDSTNVVNDGFTYSTDSLAVESILAPTGDTATVADVSTMVNGRVVRLDLTAKNLTAIPPDIGNLTALQVLILNSNQLDSLPSSIGMLKNLVSLECGNWVLQNDVGLKKLPLTIGQLKKLKYLLLFGNRIQGLPSNFDELTNLKLLDLMHNQIREFPKEIVYLQNLEFLKLSFNLLDTIPPEIINMAKISILDLGSNSLERLPNEIGFCSALQDLIIYGNSKLKSFPDSIIKLNCFTSVDDIRCEPLSCAIRQWLERHANLRGIWLDPQGCPIPIPPCSSSSAITLKPNANNPVLNRGQPISRIYDLQGRHVVSSRGIRNLLKNHSGVYVTLPADKKSGSKPKLVAVIK